MLYTISISNPFNQVDRGSDYHHMYWQALQGVACFNGHAPILRFTTNICSDALQVFTFKK